MIWEEEEMESVSSTMPISNDVALSKMLIQEPLSMMRDSN
jgi:hypothetical protein